MSPISNASRLAEFGSGIGTDGAVFQVDNANKRIGIGTTNPQGMLQVGTGVSVYGNAGIVSATDVRADTLRGDGTNITGVVGVGTLNVRTNTLTSSGIVTITNTTDATSTTTGALIISGGVGIAKSLHVGQNITIGGTLTYEDVTNIDSLGVVTARSGVNVSGGQFLVGSGVTIGNAGVATFSGTSDVHLLDSVKLNLGDGSDLSIYHNGSNGYSYIEDTGSGRLVVKTSYFEIDNEAGNEAILEGIADGAVKAYYNGSLKLETTSGGIQVTGNDGVTIVGAQDNSADLFFNADGGDDNDDKWYLGAYAGGPFKLLNYASGSWETNIEANGNGNVELYFNDSKKLETTNDGVNVTGIVTATSKVQINTPTIRENDEVPLLVKALKRETPAIAVQGPNSNGWTVLSDAYTDGESQFSLGLHQSGSALFLGRCVGVSTTANNEYVSLQDEFAYRPAGMVIDSGTIKFRTATANGVRPVGTAVTMHDRVIINRDGEVGIGTDDPQLKLHIHSESSNAAFSHFTNSTTGVSASDGVSIGLDSDENAVIYNYESSAIRFATGGSEKARVDSSGRLLIGVTSADTDMGSNLQVAGSSYAASGILQARTTADGNGPALDFIKSRNTTWGSHTIVQDGDELGRIYFRGDDGVNYSGAAAAIFGEIDGTPGADDLPGRLVFYTSADGSDSPTERIRIDKRGGFTFSNGALLEKVNITAGKLSNNTNINLEDGMVHYFTTQESTTSTPNIRLSSSGTLNGMMTAGDVITVTLVTTAAAGGYSANMTIDGNAITEEWVGGEAPSAGGDDGLDIYIYTIICIHASNTGDSGFKVIANKVNATN